MAMTDPGKVRVVLAQSQEEREEIFGLRYEIYVEEMGKSPPEADHRHRWIRDSLDPVARLYGLRNPEGKLVGTLRLNLLGDLDDPDSQLGVMAKALLPVLEHVSWQSISYTSRLMLQAECRGGTALGLLFNRCYGDAIEAGIRLDVCHANPGLVELYEQLGYRRFCSGIDWPGIGYQVPMLLALNDVSHLKISRSPLMRHPRARVADDRLGDGAFLSTLCSTYPGLNHRLVEPEHFWGDVGAALCDQNQEIPLFKGMQDEQVRALLKTGTVLSCQAGDHLVRHGDPQRDLFVVLDGVAEVWRQKDNGERLSLALIRTGSVFGEMGFLGRQRRSADVVAVTSLRVLVLTQTFLRRAIRCHPEAAALMLRNLSIVLSERLSTTTDRLWQLSQSL